MTPERRIIYVDAQHLTWKDMKQVREQLTKLGNEPVLILRQRAWVAFLMGAFVGALALSVINWLR